MSLSQDFLRLVPVSILLSTLQVGTVVTVKVLKNSVLVLQSTISLHWRGILDSGKSSVLLLRRKSGSGGWYCACGER